MEFNKAYNRDGFMKFLEVDFLPQDFIKESTPINIAHQTNYIQKAIKLGVCESLDLVVYEVKHSGKHDPRVGLSKESFKLLAQEWQGKALIAFVPMDSDVNYRFSYISIDLDITEEGKIKKSFSNPRRYSYYLGDGIACHTPNKYLNSSRVKDNEDLQSRFSVEVLTKAFYNELSDWYAWAITVVKFPNDINDDTDDDKYNTESIIRLITRLMFVWFIKQRGLVPNEFFDEAYIRENLLENFNPNTKIGLFFKSEESKYYKAILQNLFFAMLNSPISPEGKEIISERRFANGRNDYNNNKLMRYKDKFLDPDLFVELANGAVPFLNGGLFDCLDDKDKGFYIDGFSNREKVQKALIVPDYLFFGEEVGKNIDLSDFYGDKKKKNVSASGIIDILKRYNFTVEENTPFDQDVSLDPELLGKVFENLLASYNPETKTTARKQTGSFYTPREIVQYMVDESLVAHLKRTVGEELEEEYRKLMRYTDEEINLSEEQKKSIIESLYECKVLDPACGSGAFPVGILQQMVHILTQLDPDNTSWKTLLLERAVDDTTEAFKNISSEERGAVIKDINHSFDEKYNNPDYSRKLYLIENCIYGVDIQSIAIQISKLRFFISLVVDQKITNNAAKNFGIRPLPNLEAKFVAANTLIGLNKSEATLFNLEQIKELEKELKIDNQKIFSVKSYQTKRKYRQLVKELRSQISELLLENDVIGSDQARQLASWDMFDQNASSPFFDPEWMFGVHGGFDIVIGNPPYVQLQSNEGALAEQFKNENYETYARTGDIYSLFYEKGWQLLSKDGLLCYITSNKWMRAGYGEKTRAFFTRKTNPLLLIDFAGTKIFESATVDTNILLFSKSSNKENTLCAIVNNKTCLNNLSDFVQQNSSSCSFKEGDSWVILSPMELSIKRKIEAIGTPLKDWDIQINYGIKTGCNEAFIITGAKKDEILSKCSSQEELSRTVELIRPILRGRDIKRYSAEFADLWLINTHNGVRGKFPRIDINDYPAVKTHLDQYWKQIEKRADQGDTPYNLRNCAYMEDFSKPKIVYPNMTKYMPFYLDTEGLFVNQKCFILTGVDLAYLTAFFNSNIFKICYRDVFPELQGGTRELSKVFFEKVKIPSLQSLISEDFRILVKDMEQEKNYGDIRFERALILSLGLSEYEDYILKYHL